MRRRVVFISHVKREAAVARALQEVLESSFLAMIEVFVSSDPNSLPAGEKWFDRITSGLKECAVEIVIASPSSINRPWINFEAGAGYLREIPVIPVCHSGMIPSRLPPPLSSLMGVTATVEDELQLIVPTLAKAIGCGRPNIDWSNFIERVREFEQTESFGAESAISDVDGLRQHELSTLIALAELSVSPGATVECGRIADYVQKAGFRTLASNIALSVLEGMEFVKLDTETDWNHNEYRVATMQPDGWSFLGANSERISLKAVPVVERDSDARDPVDVIDDDDVPF